MAGLNFIFQKYPIKIKTFGNSMYPLLHDGDVVTIKKIGFSKIKINDIICAKLKNNFVTHRVIYKQNNYLISKGDNNAFSDGKIYPRSVLGIVNKTQRGNEEIGLVDLYLIQSTFYFKEIIKVKKAFENKKIEFLILKGLPLYLHLTKSHPKRFYGDCDFLIARSDLLKVEKLFERLGYKKEKAKTLSEKLEMSLTDKSEVTFVKFNNGIPINFDVHLEVVFMMTTGGNLSLLYPQKLIDKLSEEFLFEKESIIVGDEKFPVLSCDNLLIYLALHLFHHDFKLVSRYDFLDLFVRKSHKKLNYSLIVKKIKHYRLENFTYPSFLLLKKHLKSPIPSSFLSAIKPQEKIERFIKKDFLNRNIFDEEKITLRKKMRDLIYLSPETIYKKWLLFFHYRFLFMTILAIYKKTNSLINLTKHRLNNIHETTLYTGSKI